MRFLIFLWFIVIFALVFNVLYARENLCQDLMARIKMQEQLDVGDDPNFKLITQRNNQQLIKDCQAYEAQHIRRLSNEDQDYGQYAGYYNQHNPRN